jgi:hypothetical protein
MSFPRSYENHHGIESAYSGSEDDEDDIWHEGLGYWDEEPYEEEVEEKMARELAIPDSQVISVREVGEGLPRPLIVSLGDTRLSFNLKQVVGVSAAVIDGFAVITIVGDTTHNVFREEDLTDKALDLFADPAVLKVCDNVATEAVLAFYSAKATTTMEEINDEIDGLDGVVRNLCPAAQFPTPVTTRGGLRNALQAVSVLVTYAPLAPRANEGGIASRDILIFQANSEQMAKALEQKMDTIDLREHFSIAAWLRRKFGDKRAWEYLTEHGVGDDKDAYYLWLHQWPVYRTQYFGHPRFWRFTLPPEMSNQVASPQDSARSTPIAVGRKAEVQLMQSHLEGRMIMVALQIRCAACPCPRYHHPMDRPFCGLEPIPVGKLRQGAPTPTWAQIKESFARKQCWPKCKGVLRRDIPDYCFGINNIDLYVYLAVSPTKCEYCMGGEKAIPTPEAKFFNFVIRNTWEFRVYALTHSRAQVEGLAFVSDGFQLVLPGDDPREVPQEWGFFGGVSVMSRLRRMWGKRQVTKTGKGLKDE